MSYFKNRLFELINVALIGMILGVTGGFMFILVFLGLSGPDDFFIIGRIIYEILFYYVLIHFALVGLITALLTKLFAFKPFNSALLGSIICLILNLLFAFSLPIVLQISNVENQTYIFQFLISSELVTVHIFTFILGLIIGFWTPILTAKITSNEFDMS